MSESFIQLSDQWSLATVHWQPLAIHRAANVYIYIYLVAEQISQQGEGQVGQAERARGPGSVEVYHSQTCKTSGKNTDCRSVQLPLTRRQALPC